MAERDPHQNGTTNHDEELSVDDLVEEAVVKTVPACADSPLNVLRAYDIVTTTWPEPVWAVPDYLPAGLNIFAGAQKLGKSWLMLQLSRAVATGGTALGRRVERGPVLYLALEDNPRRLQARMSQQEWPQEPTIHADFLTLREFADQIGDLRRGGSQQLARHIEHVGYRLVVLDTLSRAIWGDQKDASEMTRWLSPLQALALEHNCALVVIDHHHKAVGSNIDPVSNILGSQAKGAVADTIWGLYRERGKAGAKLAMTGRDVTERTLQLEWDQQTGTWHVDGDADALALTPRRRELLEALETLGPAPLMDICQDTGQNKGNAYRRLQDLVAAGYVVRDGDGQGAQYRRASNGTG